MRQEGYTRLTKNNGCLLLKIPQDILEEIKVVVDEVQDDFSKAKPFNPNLVGHIDKEYEILLTNKATQYIRYTVEEYNKAEPNYWKEKQKILGRISTMEYDGHAWINFQEKYEYNPMHTHTGLFSYVIWYQIPYSKEDEEKYGAGKNRSVAHYSTNGEFSFIFDDGGELVTHPMWVDKTMEGYIAVFPSSLNHIVYPFYTSDDYRITISGNVFISGK